MSIVYKYPLNKAESETIVKMPVSAKVLTVQVQDGLPMLWAIVDPTEPLVERKFHVIMTGEFFESERYRYVGTVLMSWLVGHVFEESNL